MPRQKKGAGHCVLDCCFLQPLWDRRWRGAGVVVVSLVSCVWEPEGRVVGVGTSADPMSAVRVFGGILFC